MRKGYIQPKITIDITGVLCAEEEENGVGLSIFEQLDDKKQLFIATDLRFEEEYDNIIEEILRRIV